MTTQEPVERDRLLETEDDPAFVTMACPTTGVLAWPAIRSEFLRLILADQFYRGGRLVNLHHRSSLRRMAFGATRAFLHKLSHPSGPSATVFLASGAGLVPQGGRSVNRYVDHFADALGTQAWTMESLVGDGWPKQPRANSRLGFMASYRLRLAIEARLSVGRTQRDLARALIELAGNRARDLFGYELREAQRLALVDLASRRLAAYPAQARYAEGLVGRFRPRLFVVEEGCYGHMAVFNSTARQLGVTVAEFQHGMVTRGHDTYNVAPRLAESRAYKQTLPNAFLSYGEWWNSQFNAPVDEKVVIGNPHRTEVLRGWKESPRSTVLVLGDGVETAAYLALCQRFMSLLPSQLRVSFRPHPMERSSTALHSDRLVAIDDSPDIYQSFKDCQVVIGESSTALFEAIGLVPRVLVWDTSKSRFFLGDHPFERFTDPDDVPMILASASPIEADTTFAKRVWAPNWRDRFLDYVARVN